MLLSPPLVYSKNLFIVTTQHRCFVRGAGGGGVWAKEKETESCVVHRSIPKHEDDDSLLLRRVTEFQLDSVRVNPSQL